MLSKTLDNLEIRQLAQIIANAIREPSSYEDLANRIKLGLPLPITLKIKKKWSSRKEYLHEWHKKNKKRQNEKSLEWHKKNREKLGEEGFKNWKKTQNLKRRLKLKT